MSEMALSSYFRGGDAWPMICPEGDRSDQLGEHGNFVPDLVVYLE